MSKKPTPTITDFKAQIELTNKALRVLLIEQMTDVIISRVRAEHRCFYSIVNENLGAVARTRHLHPIHLDLLDQLFHQEHEEHESLWRAETVSVPLKGSTMFIKALPTAIFSNSEDS